MTVDPFQPSIQFSCGEESPGKLAWLKRKATGLDQRVISITGNMGDREIFHREIQNGRVATNKKNLDKILQSKEWVPLCTKSCESRQEAGALTENELVFVQVDELAQESGLSSSKVEKLKNILGSDDASDLKIIQIKRMMDAQLEIKAQNQLMMESLGKKLEQPVDADVLARADDVLERSPRNPISEEQRGALTPLRLGSSMTLKGDPSKIACWHEADLFIASEAQAKRPLEVKTLCTVNDLCAGDGEEAAALEMGQIRNTDVRAGGDGPTYVPWERVGEEFENFLVDLDGKIQECEALREAGRPLVGEDNPIVIAARAAQHFVSLHPFNDGNGRAAGFVADYVLERFGLPPASRSDASVPAIFCDQPELTEDLALRTPTTAVEVIANAVERSYDALNSPPQDQA